MASFEEKVCVFNDIESKPLGDLWFLEESSDSREDSPQRINNLYWESQLTLLEEILERYQMTGSKLRKEVDGIINSIKASDYCSCFKPNDSYNCTICLRRRVATILCDRGFTANLCTSKWKATDKFPGGSHEYIEVIAVTATRKKQIRLLIELEFKEQFQIAKACEEYRKLVSCLPQFYVGKPEHLTTIVRLVCEAAKKSMKENKMYVGPWRKSEFMQMKWSGFRSFSGAPNVVVTVN
ncbi:unnamed protein product [Trifolium pratense]|uniref:Uncharacterized protein n=1 Tax=Trifolium pratense TaxID=57577 RepID=A0ACB0K3E8_TRIPR|nr:unnamed protein product [Trifolium pratense]